MLRMANKLWTIMLGFSTLVFAALTIGFVAWAMMEHEWRVLPGALYFGLFTWRSLSATRSRIKYGAKPPSADVLEHFHVDF